jgi:UbiD family decarboxylase
MGENQSLSCYLNGLEQKTPQDIMDIREPIDRDFVFMALAKELDKEEFPPLIRCQLKGYDTPVIGNVFASQRRIANMLGFKDEGTISEAWNRIEQNLIKPQIVAEGPVQEIIQTGDEIDVGVFPWMQYYPSDAGRYVSSGIVVVKDKETGVHNLSIHRMQYKSANKFGISLHSRQHLFHHYQKAEQTGEPLNVAIIIGAHPAVSLGAAAKAALDVDEYDISGSVLREPLRLVRGKTVDIEYPAEAEIVLEGYISTTEHDPEGPFGEFTGYSTSRSTNNVFIVTAVCRRAKPIYEVVAPGPSKDHLFMGHVVREAGVFQRLKERIPWVTAIAYPTSGVNFHCYVQLEPCPAGVAKQALTLLMGSDHQLKFVVAVDEDIDIHRDEEVMWAIATRCQMQKDLFMVPGSFTISLDPSSVNNTVDKIGIDATMRKEMRDEVIILRSNPEDKAKALQIIAENRK